MNIKINKDHNEQNYKKKIIVLFVVVFILLIISMILTIIEKRLGNEPAGELSYDNLTTVKEVIEYYKSTYIGERETEDPDYKLNIDLVLAKMPYEDDDTSNEEYYNNLINDVAKILYFKKNFKMIDDKNNIIIKVICQNGKIASIIINDIEDYFIYQDSQISMKKFKDVPVVELPISAGILQECIDNGWASYGQFGSKESLFEDYAIYFDEGMKVRTINNKVYNIIFDKRYEGEVIGAISVGIDPKSIKSSLGEPSFEDEELNIIGYKGEKVYAFFTENEISIYRAMNDNTDEFFKLADEYLDKKIDFLEFMNLLTYMWPDYSDYDYSANSVFISYPLKGIEIRVNNGDTDGFLVYNNIRSSLSKIGRYLDNTEFIARLQLDAVFEAEKRRVENQINLKIECEEYQKNLDSERKKFEGESIRYGIVPMKDSNDLIYTVKFISLSGENPNRQLNDSMDSYLWIDNDTFLYSKKQSGILLFDLNTGEIRRIIKGDENFELKEYKNGIVKYDKDKEIAIY